MLYRDLQKYLESLTVTQGQGVGTAFKPLPWEKRFIKGAFTVTGDAALSVGRGNGKTTLIAGIGAAAVDDTPLRQPRAEVVITASSFDQGKIDYDHVRAFLTAKGHDLNARGTWRIQDSVNKATIEHRETGAKIKCQGSDPRRAHGAAINLAICDEPAQWPGATSDAMFSAIKTGCGKIPGSRIIALGTRPADPEHWFEKMLNGGADYSQCHAADPDDKPFLRSTWLKANPSLRYMPHLLARIQSEARDAKKDSSLLPQFNALRLNLGTADHEIRMLLEADTWRNCEGQIRINGGYVLGLDLGTSAAMSAAAAYWPETGALDAFACFGNNPGLAERGLKDGAGRKYVDMHKRNELILSEGRTSKIPDLLSEILRRWGPPAAVSIDRWREDELRDELEAHGFPVCPLIIRGMGFLDGGADVREFRRAVLDGKVTPARSLLLRYCISEARTICDPAGNEKLAKGTQGQRRLRARDDACAAAILSVAVGHRNRGNLQQARSGYLGQI